MSICEEREPASKSSNSDSKANFAGISNPDRGAQGPCAPCLKPSEWIFLLAVISLIFSTVWISKKTSFRSLSSVELPQPISKIQIEVAGCVRHHGPFEVMAGTSVRSILRKAQPQKMADLTRIDLNTALESSTRIEVPMLECIEVTVEGCVKDKVHLKMPMDSRICDLFDHVVPASDADPAFFKRKRRLKNLDVIQVPRRKSK